MPVGCKSHVEVNSGQAFGGFKEVELVRSLNYSRKRIKIDGETIK